MWVGPKSKDKCPYKRETEGDVTPSEESDVKKA